jgi:hypothetical protein
MQGSGAKVLSHLPRRVRADRILPSVGRNPTGVAKLSCAQIKIYAQRQVLTP